MQFKSLEALRGIAAIMVALFHSTFYLPNPSKLVMHSDLFVDFFFVLSGFVMTYAYQDKIAGGLSFKRFFILRIGRLYPLHFFMLLVWLPYILLKAFIYSKGFGGTDPLEASNAYSFVLNVFFLQALASGGGAGWNWPSWSVALEFYVYLLFYLFLIIENNYRTILAPLLMAIISFLLLYNTGPLLEIGWHSLFRCIGGFFLGVFLYRFYKPLSSIKFDSKIWPSFMELIALAFMLWAVSHYGSNPKIFFALSIISFVVVIFVFSCQEKGIFSFILNASLFQYIGKLSYSIYLTHGIVMAAASNVVLHLFKLEKQNHEAVSSVNAVFFDESLFLNAFLIFVVLCISAITFKYVETPWRDKSRQWARAR